MLWDGLCHPNILPMLGIANNLGLASYMVSPWVKYGNAKEYLQSAKDPDVLQLLLGIARGVEYIHNQQPAIVHGDLKLANILITQSGRPLISDFGSSQLWRGDDDIHFVEGMGTTRWMSPEYIISGRPTIYSDMYAFGMVILEVISGDIPFCDVKRDSEVALKVMKGERPERPKKTEGNGIIDNLWPISERCWDHCSKLRPTTHDLVQELHLFVRPV
ncbi:kinase-like protein [Rickenella mellea]|uniref:Kinase-like protein n=1 Tax=Rickenella mellea TaxID=50990 RepID=A0A4Y7PIQ9_9AGAM|nr:kinase-like protein [Rickenella mellea]